MIDFLREVFRSGKTDENPVSFQQFEPSLPPGDCLVAVGDIHGRLDLLNKLIVKIKSFFDSAGSKTLVFLGDVIDRGSDSAGVVEVIAKLKSGSPDFSRVILLKGNHEALMMDFLNDPAGRGKLWLDNGGNDTLKSYGVFPPDQISPRHLSYLATELSDKMPAHHKSILKSAQTYFTKGDYFLCHAGVDPVQALDQQSEATLLWKRDMAFFDEKHLDKMIVHGHTPHEKPLIGKGHINIDTAAYLTGNLTALILTGKNRHIISTLG